MARLDEVKERLNNYRLAITLLIGVESLVLAGVISSYRSGVFDLYYWLGADFAILLVFVFVFVVRNLLKLTDRIGEL
jgi:biotin transporter BioY